MLAGDIVSAFHNTLNPRDVNFDQRVSPSDLLVIVNDLLRNGSRSLAAEEVSPLSASTGSERPRYIDVNNDGRVSVSDMMVVVNALLATNNMQVKTIVTDLAGNDITSISVGAQFKLQTIVTDIRTPPQSETRFQGVFSAGADILYSSALSSIDTSQTVAFGSFFGLIQDSDLQQGQVVGYASTSNAQGPGNAQQFLFSVVLTATAGGTQVFTPTLYTSNPDNEYNMYLIDPPFPTDTIEFVGDTLEIIDLPAFSIADTSGSETNADHPAIFTVSLSQAAAAQTTVAYTTTDGSATVANNDYVGTSGTLTFTAGVTTALITVTVKGDQNIESDETFNVVLSNPISGTILAVSSAVGTIINDDLQGVLTIADAPVDNVIAGTTTAFVTVTLSHTLGSQATVQYATANNTAFAGVDYQATSGTLTFNPGVLTQTVSVTIFGDPNPDDVDRFFVNLSNPSANATISDSQAEVVIEPAVVGVSVDITRDVANSEGDTGEFTPFVFTITLSAASTGPVQVAYETADGTATAGSDYVAQSATITFTPGQTAQSITIQAIGDSVQEGSETFQVNMQAVSGGVGSAQATGTIIEDDGPPTLTVSDAVVAAGTGLAEAVFTVTLSGAVTEAVTVGYSTENSSAIAGSDYLVATGNLLFVPGGATTQEVRVTVLSSGAPQDDKTFFLNLSSATPTGVILGDDQGVATIITQGLSISDASVVEGVAGTTRDMVFTVALSRPSIETVTVAYTTQNGTAFDPSDYLATSGTATFAPNTSIQLITVTVNGDDIAEGNESFKVILSDSEGAPLFNAEGTGTIINDDGKKVLYKLALLDLNEVDIPLGTQLDVNDEFFLRVYVENFPADATGVAQAFLDVLYEESLLDVVGTVDFGDYFSSFTSFDFEPGLLNDFGGFGPFTPPVDPAMPQILYTVRFKATDVGLVNFVGSADEDDLANGNETLLYFSIDAEPVPSEQIEFLNPSINVGSNVITVSNATANESGQMVFTVTRFLPTNQTATVEYKTANGTALAGLDYLAQSGTLTFDAGNTVRLVMVSLINDTIDEADETFSLVLLSPPVNASISAAAATGTIIDDDGAPAVSVTGGSASEGQNVVFNVTLAQASGKTVTVVYATTGVGTATAGLDYTSVSGTLTFAPGITQQSVTVPTLGDILLEANETFQLALSNPTNAVLGTASAQGTIVDVPPAGISGYVYVDLNGNGLKDLNETGIQEAIVTATNTLTGASQSVLTAADGSYALLGLIPGTYTLTETQPGFFADGRDTRFGVDSPLNDQWVGIQLASSQAASGYNFGEQGIRGDFLSAFFNRRALFASATVGGFGPNVNLPGTQLNLKTGDIWVSFDGGWSGLRHVEALFDSANGAVTMKLYNTNLQEVALSAPSANGAILLYNGQVGTAYFLKISGSNPTVTVQISTPTAINLTATGGDQGSASATPAASTPPASNSSGGFNRFASAIPLTAPAADPLVADEDTSGAFVEDEDWLLESLLA